MKIKYLAWDSNFFNKRVGTLVYTNTVPDESGLLKKLQIEEKYDLLYIIAHNEKNCNEICKTGAVLMDRSVTYHKTTNFCTGGHNNAIIPYNGSLTTDLLELAYESGHKSRFKLDPFLNTKFKDIYRIWIEKSLSGELADRVFIYQDEEKIEGFITVSNKSGIGSIGLIAVSKNKQGRGIGKLLLNKTDQWFQQQNIKRAEVVTQSENKGACRFYEKNGYVIKEIQYIYHLWKT